MPWSSYLAVKLLLLRGRHRDTASGVISLESDRPDKRVCYMGMNVC